MDPPCSTEETFQPLLCNNASCLSSTRSGKKQIVMPDKRLRIYLNDHSAGALTGIELAKRCLKNNEGNELGKYLRTFVAELEEDRSELHQVMDALGLTHDKVKSGMGWAAEKAGRLKLNGQLTGYSPLSRLWEIEGLVLGVTGKRSLWRSLKQVAEKDPRVAVIDLDRLEKRAQAQLEELERHRLEAAKEAF